MGRLPLIDALHCRPRGRHRHAALQQAHRAASGQASSCRALAAVVSLRLCAPRCATLGQILRCAQDDNKSGNKGNIKGNIKGNNKSNSKDNNKSNSKDNSKDNSKGNNKSQNKSLSP